MTGVEILNEYAVYATQVWVATVGILALIGGIIFLFAFGFSKCDVATWVNLVCMIVCFATFFILVVIDNYTDHFKEYSHTEYKVTIDDSVSMNDFMDKYEILDQEGKIYTVKERE